MRKHIDSAFKILTKVFQEGTYSNMAFYGEDVSDMTTKLVYGVLENNVKIEYILSRLVDKKPKNAIYCLLKIGTYALIDLTDVPKFAIVSECVEVAKLNGKGGASGFINAVLKKVASGKYDMPSYDDENYLSITYSKPQWFIDKMLDEYGKQTTIDMLSAPYDALEHIRINLRLTTCQSVENELNKHDETYRKSDVGGYVVRASKTVKHMFDKGLVTYQSPSSMIAVQALGAIDGEEILDICSAPGGKAIYLSELCPHSLVTACDLHEHRVTLIQKYKMRMHTPNVKAIKADATEYNEAFDGKFNHVLVDAPCSCLGTYRKHPDVFLSKDLTDVDAISQTQRKIVKNACEYVRVGGTMVYSTCTLFKQENGDIADYILQDGRFKLEKIALDNIDDGKYKDNDGRVQILPHGEYDGFYVAKFRRVK